MKKGILSTLLQAAKALKGGVLAIKGQLIKGSGYILSTKGKLLEGGGEAITGLGKKIVKSAIAKSHKHGHDGRYYNKYFENKTSLF